MAGTEVSAQAAAVAAPEAQCGEGIEGAAFPCLGAGEALCSCLSLLTTRLPSLPTCLCTEQWLSPVTPKIALVQLPSEGHALFISWGLAIHFTVPY